ncbi:MAG: AmmeMemoRadiSam system protein A [Planctomycetota bacterium]
MPQKGGATLPKDVSVSSTPTDPTNPTTAKPQPSKPPTLLNLDRIGEEQKEKACQFAADWLVGTVLGKQPETPPRESLGDFAEAIVMGAFVTVKRGDVLRGCCGVLGKPMTLGAAIGSAAAKTAKEDQRMAAVSASELPYLDLDVTLLGPFQKVNAQGSDRMNAIEIGKHGLMIRRGEQSGLLLPSVATERRWDAEQFLHAVCQKANLPISAWEHADTQLFTFDGTPMGAPLKKYLPETLNSFVPSVLNGEVLNSYTRIVGQNIVAFCSGGTPSYVIPELPDATVNGVVLSLQWYADGEKKDLQQGNLVQVSFRPGVPLQSTLYQMSQQAAQMFRVRGFSGHLQVGITVGIDPAMHGYGMKADLEGINPVDRGLVISDPRHCGLAFNPEEDVEKLREKLREILPISSRDASVHSMQIVSTMPRIISVSGPQAALASGQRPPAVAGKFYPGEDAARRAMVGTLFKDEAPSQVDPLAIMVPHAGIKYSGKTAAKAWWSVENLGKKPIIVISPKHTADGVNWSACPLNRCRVRKSP